MDDSQQTDRNTGPTGETATVTERPEYIPEKFWDAEKGAPKIDELGKSYVELERLAGELKRKVGAKREEWAKELEAERLAHRPEKPEAYEAKLPEDLAEAVELANDHPLMAWWREFAWERGLGAEEFNAGLERFVRWQLESAKAQEQALEEELAKLGDHGPQRVQHVEGWIRTRLGEDGVAALEPLLRSAAAIEALEKLMESVGERRFVPVDTPAKVDAATLRQWVEDPRYWRDRDPVFVKQVTEGFARLYGSPS